MSDVKEEEVVNRITKMAAELHFSGDRSSILGMKVSADVTNWGNMDDKREVDLQVRRHWGVSIQLEFSSTRM